MIGGGLTAIDTATELMAYYPLQVEKTMRQYETLAVELGESALPLAMDVTDLTAPAAAWYFDPTLSPTTDFMRKRRILPAE